MTFLEEAADQLNLRWAYEKVRKASLAGEFWSDDVEVAGFELELERNLQSIAVEFRRGRYRMAAIRPLPFPKDPDKAGVPRIRQYFHVPVRDQVAWTAVVNVVGPHVDRKMPTWSYGNRLFRSRWVEEAADGVKRRRIGRYRHSSGRLYLPFRQSWPVFRRHVYLTTGAMAAVEKLPESDEGTEEELSMQERLEAEERCPFVVRGYWSGHRPAEEKVDLFWCSIDLERFYPNLRLAIVQETIVEHLPPEWRSEADRLLGSMLRFPLDLSEWRPEDLDQILIRPGSKTFRHLPTGLYVAGFLANAGLLRVDLKVSELLKGNGVAHFRFVDDHIVLAYSFPALVAWVEGYVRLLKEARTGARVNPEKVEPEELAPYLAAREAASGSGASKRLAEKAEKACKLDPQFPSPLMTKTLALVSAIARTDFNLLEEAELEALTDQLEQMLLVEFPAEEIPEKTRLAFAATRLTRVAECRLANDTRLTELRCQYQAMADELADEKTTLERKAALEQEAERLKRQLGEEDGRLKREMERAFGLLRKVLRERPDRVRLWTRAVLMCRQTGVQGLKQLFEDVRSVQKANPLAAEYLRGIILALLGNQAMAAARILRSEDSAEWRRVAAASFLEDACRERLEPVVSAGSPWFVRTSWEQFGLGMYFASLMLGEAGSRISFPEEVTAVGRERLQRSGEAQPASGWLWWVARRTLYDLEPELKGFVKGLAERVGLSQRGAAFWRFFPEETPIVVLRRMVKGEEGALDMRVLQGWWFDALRRRRDSDCAELLRQSRTLARVRLNLESARGSKRMSLYDWCERMGEVLQQNPGDPRAGEWTALEIVRQIACLMVEEPMFGLEYLIGAKRVEGVLPCVHPANFRVPREWLQGSEVRWERWTSLVRRGGAKQTVEMVPQTERLLDVRYTPLHSDSPLFSSVNPVRGLGLLLYGLLRRSFRLPALWNGPGHSDVLRMLPTLLLREMTCSSWTLGVLQGCLQARTTENLFFKGRPARFDYHVDDDMLQDPVAFFSPAQVRDALAKCQSVLEENQLSTLNHKARQLTPVSVRQLTEPDWSAEFPTAETGEDTE